MEELDEIQKHVNILDSVARILGELFNLLSIAISVLQRNQKRASVVRRGTPGRLAFDISREKLEMILRARLIKCPLYCGTVARQFKDRRKTGARIWAISRCC